MLQITAKLLWFDESEFAAIIGTLVYNESQCNFLRRSTFDPAGTRLSLADLISAPSELHNLHAYQVAILQWFPHRDMTEVPRNFWLARVITTNHYKNNLFGY